MARKRHKPEEIVDDLASSIVCRHGAFCDRHFRWTAGAPYAQVCKK